MIVALDDLRLLLEAGASALRGGGVGWERQRMHDGAGLRTMRLVSRPSGLFVDVSVAAGAGGRFKDRSLDAGS